MIAIYLRLSMSDGDLGHDGKDESNSIENQRVLLRDHIKRRKDLSGDVAEYIDDGYSGTNFDRPGFRRLLEDMKKGKIDVLLTKDLSRLGRNYIDVGDYMDQIFPALGVRYIAVNSNYDSNDYLGLTTGLEMSVMNLVNSLYSKDLSKKHRSAVQTKWKKGSSTNGRPAFGYIRDPENKGKWLVDPVAAEIVRNIFDLAIACNTVREIVDKLNKDNTFTPGQYREMSGHVAKVSRKVTDSEWLWNTGMVYRILENYEYTGALVQSKRKTIIVGSTHTRLVPENERFITEGHHEPIVSAEEFRRARSIIREVKKGAAVNVNDYPLSEVIYCGNCGLRMQYPLRIANKYVFCQHKAGTGKASKCCDAHHPRSKIDAVVSKTLNSQLRLMDDLKRIAEKTEQKYIDSNDAVRMITDELSALQVDKTRAYESYADGHMTREAYIEKRDQIKNRIELLRKKQIDMSKPLAEIRTIREDAEEYLGKADGLHPVSELSKEVVDAFIQRVVIYDEEHIEIKFKFDDLIEQLICRTEGAVQKGGRNANDDQGDIDSGISASYSA